MHIYDNKIVITEIKSFNFTSHLSENAGEKIKHEFDHIMEHHGFIAKKKNKKQDWPIIVQI